MKEKIMNAIDRLYEKGNITIQKSINVEDKLYTRVKEIIDNDFEATFSDVINICVENLLSHKENLKYYHRPDNEILIYRSVMLRKENLKELENIRRNTGISITRLVNMAIKEFLEKYDNK